VYQFPQRKHKLLLQPYRGESLGFYPITINMEGSKTILRHYFTFCPLYVQFLLCGMAIVSLYEANHEMIV
jgi:hypothetical protein